MITAEERYQLIMTLCDNINHAAGLIVDCCDLLIEDTGGPFREEQKIGIKRIQESAQKILLQVEAVKADVLETNTATGFEELRFRIFCFLNDMGGYLTTILGFAQISLDEKLGSLSEKQREIMAGIEKLGRSLNSTSSEFLEFLRKTKG
jgi:hypothetical protein